VPREKLPTSSYEAIVKALEVSGSIARTSILGAVEGVDELLTGDKEDSSIPISDIVHGKQYMTAERFMDGIAKVFGGSYDTKGTNWLDSGLKFAAELAVDIGTDPLSYVPLVGEGAMIGKGVSKYLFKNAPKVMAQYAPKITEKVINQTLTRGAIGGTVGALYPVAEDENQLSSRIANAISGAALVSTAGPAASGVVKGMKLGSNIAIDLVYNKSNPEVIAKFKKVLDPKNAKMASPSEAYRVSRRAKDNFTYVTRDLNMLNAAIVKKFGPEAVDSAVKTFDSYIPSYVKDKNHLHLTNKVRKTSYEKKNRISTLLNDKYEAQIKADGKWTPVMDALIARNNHIIKEYNKAQKVRFTSMGKEHTPLIGISIHTPDVLDIDKLGKYSKADAQAGLLARTSEEAVKDGGLTGRQRLALENDRVIFSMMNAHEKNATRFLSELSRTGSKKDFYKNGAKAIEFLDGVTMDMKGAMLTLSHSWLRNNFAENSFRAFMEHGFEGGAEAALKQGRAVVGRIQQAFGKDLKGELSDLMKLTKSENAATEALEFMDKTGLTEMARNHGVLNSSFYKETLGEMGDKGFVTLAERSKRKMLEAVQGEKAIAAKILKAKERGRLVRTKDEILKFGKDTVGDTGALIENTARLNTFKHSVRRLATKEQYAAIKKHGYKDALKYHPELNGIYERSGKIVDKTFFNYAELSFGEEQVMKRLLPFYSFYSKNLHYWGDMISNDIAKFSKGSKALNQAVNYDINKSEKERMMFSEYERSSAHGIDREGKISTAPRASISDFLEAVSSPIGYTRGKVHPLLAGGVTMANIIGYKVGAFDEPRDAIGRKLLASSAYHKKRSPFHGERKVAILDEMLGSPFGTIRDREGELQVTSDLIPTVSAVTSMVPIPILDTKAKLREGGDLVDEMRPITSKEKTRREMRSTYKRNLQQRKRLDTGKKKERQVQMEVDRYNSRTPQSEKIQKQAEIYRNPASAEAVQQIHQEEITDGGRSPLINNKKKMKKSPWNALGIKSSPRLINKLVGSEGYVPVADRLGKGKFREKGASAGYSIYGVYPTTYGTHIKGQPIKKNDTMDEKESAIQLVAYIKDSESYLNRALSSSNTRVTSNLYDAIIHAGYNVGKGHYKRIAKQGLAYYFMTIPATVNGVLNKDLLRRREMEFNWAKNESMQILDAVVQKVGASNLSQSKKTALIDKTRRTYYFPEWDYKGLRHEDLKR